MLGGNESRLRKFSPHPRLQIYGAFAPPHLRWGPDGGRTTPSQKEIPAEWGTLIKKFLNILFIGGQQHGTSVSCCCFFAVLRRQVDFSNKIVMHIDLLYPVTAGFVRGMDNDFRHKLMQKERRQFGGFGVLLHDF